MKRNPIPYGRQWVDEDDIQAVIDTLRGDWITQGPKVAEFEENFAAYCDAKYAVAVSSGTAALHLASLAAGLREGNEVITSPITFVASANCILYAGAQPVFADIDERTICIASKEIENQITSTTRGIVPVHFAGFPCDMPAIWQIARKNNFTVIEDACHGLGAQYSHEGETFKVGSCAHSHMSCFSFHPVKHITTGEGGVITTNDSALYEKLLQLRSHGITKDPKKLIRNEGPWYYEMQELGFNFRITDFQCALGLAQLKKLDYFISRRREIAEKYYQGLADVEEIILPTPPPNIESSWHLFVIQLKTLDRLKIFKHLRDKGIGAQVHYIPVHLQPYYQKTQGYAAGDFPNAERYYRRSITIPLFPAMKNNEVNFVIDVLKNTIREFSE